MPVARLQVAVEQAQQDPTRRAIDLEAVELRIVDCELAL